MDIGFIGLGNMGFPMMCRLIDAGHRVVAFDTRDAVLYDAVAKGAVRATSAADVADRASTVMASLPTPQVSQHVAAAVAHGTGIRRFVDFSTIGRQAAQHNSALLAESGVAMLDSPVSGGVHGAEAGTLALMVSGDPTEFEACAPALQAIGRPTFVGEKPGAAQTMKLINNLIAATSLAVTAEAMVLGVKAGLDAQVMLDVLNGGSGATHASREKFPRAVLPRTFDYGFATGLMVKDVRLYLDEVAALGTPRQMADTVAQLWETTLAEEGPDSDFTSIVKPIEVAAGVVIEGNVVAGPSAPQVTQ
jgi:3-hydroxyisobutyrate dehydrogenase